MPDAKRPDTAFVNDTQSVAVPEPIANKLADLYAEYIKPEHFFKWVFKQEYIKLIEQQQQQQLELQRQYVEARNQLRVQRDGWDGGNSDGDGGKPDPDKFSN